MSETPTKQNTDEAEGFVDRRGTNPFHHPQKPNTCHSCGAHVVLLREGDCLKCCSGLVTPTDTAMEHNWTPEPSPDEASAASENTNTEPQLSEYQT